MLLSRALARLRRSSDTASPLPDMAGLPLVGHAAQFREDPFVLLGQAAAKGPLVRVRLLDKLVWVVTDPALVHELLDDQDTWRRGEGLAPMLGRNMLTSNGADWTAARQLARPSFHPKMTDRGAAAFGACAAPLLDAWTAPASIDLARQLGTVFALAAPPVFGMHLRPDEAARLPAALDVLQTWAFRSLAGGSRRSSDVKAAQELLNGVLDRNLTRAPDAGPPTYLERIRQDHAVPREDLADHLRLVLFAATDNPPNTTAIILWLLAHHPEVLRQLVADIDSVLGDRLPTPADLDALPLLDRVIDESMRLIPPAWWLARIAAEDTVLGGHPMPAGTYAFIGIYWLHRHPEAWTDPDRFDPARFTQPPPAGAFLPFGQGPRRCIGTRFARQSVAMAVAMVLQRFVLTPDHPRPLPWYGRFTLRSRVGVPMRMAPR